MVEENKTEDKPRYNVVQVTTDSKLMIEDASQEKSEDRYLSTEQAIVLVLNKLDNMEKKIVG